MKKERLVIIGSGPAGRTAAIYAARSALQPLLIEGKKPLGQLMTTSYVENWPGEKRILGPELMMKIRDHAAAFDMTFMSADVVGSSLNQKPFVLTTSKAEEIHTDSLIIATGSTPKRLGVPGEDECWGKGGTTCAVCDGAFYKDGKVIIVGGGDTAMEDASFMLNFTKDITVVHILDNLTASVAMQEPVIKNPNINIIYNSTVTAINGKDGKIINVEITNQQTDKKTTMPMDAVFVAIGLNPNTGPFEGQLDLYPNGYIIVKNHTKTSVPGVFAAGDVADYIYRQAITSAGTGCMAALDAERYLKGLE